MSGETGRVGDVLEAQEKAEPYVAALRAAGWEDVEFKVSGAHQFIFVGDHDFVLVGPCLGRCGCREPTRSWAVSRWMGGLREVSKVGSPEEAVGALALLITKEA